MFDSINSLLKRSQLKNPDLLLSPQICYTTAKIIEKLIPEAKEKIEIVSFKDSRLKIAVDNSILMHRIKMCEEEIINRVLKQMHIKPFRIIFISR